MEHETFELRTDEEILRAEPVLWMKHKMFAKNGDLILTNQRLVFDESPPPIHGIAGEIAKFFFKSLRGGVRFDIPLKEIRSMSKDSFGLNIMMSLTYGAESNVKFGGIGKTFDLWQAALKSAGVRI